MRNSAWQSHFLHAQARELRFQKCRQNCKLTACISLPLLVGVIVLILWATKVIKF